MAGLLRDEALPAEMFSDSLLDPKNAEFVSAQDSRLNGGMACATITPFIEAPGRPPAGPVINAGGA